MKLVVITGASRGLGKSMALALRAKECKVIALGRSSANELDSEYRTGLDDYFQLNIDDPQAIDRVCQEIQHKHGPIDILINNAAVRLFKPFGEFPRRDIEESMRVNLLAPLLFASHVWTPMLDNNFGRIINIASISGLRAYSSGSLYCSTKAALITSTRAIARDLASTGKNVTANVICPGSFEGLNGEKFDSYDYIVKRVITTTWNLIHAKRNGAVIVVDTWPRRVKELWAQIRTAVSIFISR